jgi:putative MATE family efflux protein
MTLILGAVFTVVGTLMTPTMLHLIKMPPAEAKEGQAYLSIYFAGVLGLMIYNIGAGILRAVGDSKRPFYFLVVSALINIALDLVFVLGCNMGVAGVALATIIAQGVSAILVVITLLRSDACIKLIPKELKIHWDQLKKIVTVGIPAALQMAITAFSNVFVQSYINYFGGSCMAGWTTYAKVDQLLFLPMQSISLAATTFVGQNLGKNQPQRARQGVTQSLLLAMGFTAVLCVPVVIFAKDIVPFFVKNGTAEALEYGTLFLQWLSPFYLLCCFNQIYSSALRGAGNTRAPMIIMLSSFVLFRQAYLFIMSRVCNEILPIAMSYPAGWLVCSVITCLYYHKVQLSKTRLVDDVG